MGEWLAVYKHNRWYLFGIACFLFCLFSVFFISLLVMNGNDVAAAVSRSVAASSSEYGNSVYFNQVQDAKSTFELSLLAAVVFIGGFGIWMLYYPISLYINRNIDGKVYEGTISSSYNTYFRGVTLTITMGSSKKGETVSTGDFMSIFCTNCVGERVRFHISQRGIAIIEAFI